MNYLLYTLLKHIEFHSYGETIVAYFKNNMYFCSAKRQKFVFTTFHKSRKSLASAGWSAMFIPGHADRSPMKTEPPGKGLRLTCLSTAPTKSSTSVKSNTVSTNTRLRQVTRSDCVTVSYCFARSPRQTRPCITPLLPPMELSAIFIAASYSRRWLWTICLSDSFFLIKKYPKSALPAHNRQWTNVALLLHVAIVGRPQVCRAW